MYEQMHNNMAQIIECEICHEECQEDTLKDHREMCMARSMFRCTICDGDYVSKEGLWIHLDLHEITDESKELHYQEMRTPYKLRQCVLCNDQRGYQENLYWEHVHERHDNFLLWCSDCGEKFLSQKLKNDHDLTHCKAREQTLTGRKDSDQICSNIVLPLQDENSASLVSCGEINGNAAVKLEPSQGELSCVPLKDRKCSEINIVYQQGTLVLEKLNEANDVDSRLIEFSPANSKVGYDTDNMTEKVSEVIPISSSKSRSESNADQIPLKMEITIEETRLLQHQDFETSTPNQSTITDCPNFNQDSKDIKPKPSIMSSIGFNGKNEKESEVVPIPSTKNRSETDADQITLKMEITVEETKLLQHDDFGTSTPNKSTITDYSYVGQHSKDQRVKHTELPSVEFSLQDIALTSERKSDIHEELACTSSDKNIVDSRLNEASSLTFKSLRSANVHKKLADKGLRKAQVDQKGCSQELEVMNAEKSSSATSDAICSHCGKKFASVKSLSHHIESFCKPASLNCEKLYPDRESSQDHKMNLRKKKQLPPATRRTRQKAGAEAQELESANRFPVPSGKRSRAIQDPPVNITREQRPSSSSQSKKRSISPTRTCPPATRFTRRKAVPDAQQKTDSSEKPNCLPSPTSDRYRDAPDQPAEIASNQRPSTSRHREKQSQSLRRPRFIPPPVDHTSTSSEAGDFSVEESSWEASESSSEGSSWKASPSRKRMKRDLSDYLPAQSSERPRATQDPPVNVTSDQRPRLSRQEEKRSRSISRSRSSHHTTRRTQRKVVRDTLPKPAASESPDCLPVQKGKRSRATRDPPVNITSDQRPRSSRLAGKRSRSISRPRSSHPATRQTQREAIPDAQPKPDSPDCLPVPQEERSRATQDSEGITSDQTYKSSRQAENRSCSISLSRSNHPATRRTERSGKKRSQTLSSPPPEDHTSMNSDASESSSEESSWKAGSSRKRTKRDPSKIFHTETGFECLDCGKLFNCQTYLWHHMVVPLQAKQKRISKSMEISEQQIGDDLEQNQNSSLQKSETCSVCGLIFKNKRRLQYHRFTAHTEPKHKCSLCEKMLHTNYELTVHKKTHIKTAENVECKMCHRIFQNEHVLQRHAYSAHPPTEVSCSKCSLKFSSRDKLWSHTMNLDEFSWMKLTQMHFNCILQLVWHMKCISVSEFCSRKVHTVPKYKCSQCPRKFYKNIELNRHKITHKSPEKKEVCKLCPSTFRDAYYLQVHVRHVHSSLEFPCSMCDLKFTNRRKFNYHRRTAHAEPKHKCSQCPKMYYTNHDLIYHETTHSKTLERNVVCELCPKTFRDKYTLHKHVYNDHPPSELSCGKCALKFSTRAKLKFHMRKAHIEPTHKCSQCPKKFFTNSQLKYHETKHNKTRERNIVCELCPSTYQDKYVLNKHVYMVHSSSEMPCGKCELKFSNRYKLWTHTKKAHTVPKYKCSQCSKMFYIKHKLKEHENTIHRKKNVECSQCSNMFSTNYNLQIHVNRVHPSSELQCDICALKFSNHNKLNHHVLTTHTEPKHKCSQCPKKFYTSQNLKRHNATHNKSLERNVACELCPMTFRDDRGLQKHVYDIHPPSELPCDKCTLMFSTRNKLKCHMNTVHTLRFKCPECDRTFNSDGGLRKHMNIHSNATQKQHSSYGSKRHRSVTKGEEPSSDDSYVVDQRKIRKMPSSEIRRSNRTRTKQ